MRKKKNYLLFTLAFLVCVLVIYSVFIYHHKSFIWAKFPYDGLDQHCTSLMYYGEYLRNLLKNIFINHNFQVPLWDFSIGYGADVITNFHYYVFLDPLALLSVFVPMAYTEWLYDFLIILRLYLAGLTFIMYCHYMKKTSWSTVIGALTYVFCGFSIYASIKHPYFINPMIYLPLILIGIEKIYKKQSPVLFIVMIFISTISNFYFFYMLCLIMFIYAAFRYFHYYHHWNFNKIRQCLLKFIGYYLVGLGMAAVIFIPVVLMFFNTARSQDHGIVPLVYSFNYYLKLFFGYFADFSYDSWTFAGFNVLSFFCIILLFIHYKENKRLLLGYLLLTVLLCFPIFGCVFNGFSYVSNRWCFAYAFLVAYIIVKEIPTLLTLHKKELMIIGGIVVIESLLVIFKKQLRTSNMMFSLLLIGLLFFLLLCYRNKKINKNAMIVSICVISLFSIQGNALYRYSAFGRNYAKEFLPAHSAYHRVTENGLQVLSNISDDSFYRFDQAVSQKNNLQNASVIMKEHPLGFFFSLGNGNVTQYLSEMKNLNTLSSLYRGVDSRPSLLALSSTKYLIVEKDHETNIPYGFEKMNGIHDEAFDLYINSNYLPLGYTYDFQISREVYESLHPLDKQNVLLSQAVIDGNVPLPQLETEPSFQPIAYEVSEDANFEIADHIITTKKKDASMTLSFDVLEDQDIYFYIPNLKIQQQPSKILTKTSVRLKMDDFKNSITLYSPYASYYHGETDYLSHIGYLEKGHYTLNLNIKDKGQYTFDDIQILGQSLDDFSQKVDALKETPLTNEKIETNKVSGDISLEKDKYLCLSIPYSSGWKAYVDGQEVDLLRTNTMFMGMMLEKGEHHIELSYFTPGLKEGAIISLGSFALFSVIYIKEKKYVS